MKRTIALIASLIAGTACAFAPNDQTELECYTHYRPGETEIHPYSGRDYALMFTRIPGSEAIRQVNGYVYNPAGDIVPLTGTELRVNGVRLVSLDGLLRQHTQPWLNPDPFYHVLRHIEIPAASDSGRIHTANDNNFYQPHLEDGTPVQRGIDGVGNFHFDAVPCNQLPPVSWVTSGQ